MPNILIHEFTPLSFHLAIHPSIPPQDTHFWVEDNTTLLKVFLQRQNNETTIRPKNLQKRPQKPKSSNGAAFKKQNWKITSMQESVNKAFYMQPSCPSDI